MRSAVIRGSRVKLFEEALDFGPHAGRSRRPTDAACASHGDPHVKAMRSGDAIEAIEVTSPCGNVIMRGCAYETQDESSGQQDASTSAEDEHAADSRGFVMTWKPIVPRAVLVLVGCTIQPAGPLEPTVSEQVPIRPSSSLYVTQIADNTTMELLKEKAQELVGLKKCVAELADALGEAEKTKRSENMRTQPVDGHVIQRVGVVPPTDLSGHPDDTDAVGHTLVSALRASHPFDVVQLPTESLNPDEEWDFTENATIRQGALMPLRREFNADAIVFGQVTHYRPYTPILLGLKPDMFSAGAGDVVWEIDAACDAQNATVVQDVHNYHDTQLAPSSSLEDYKLILISPRRLTEYACSRIAATL